MSDKKIIALDLDGTLLDDEKKIPDSTKNLLKYLESEGFLIVLCSGRSTENIKTYYDDIGLKSSPIISYNGQSIVSPYKDDFVARTSYFPKDTLNDILKYMSNFSLNHIVETPKAFYMKSWDEYLNRYFNYKSKETNIGEGNTASIDNSLGCVFELEDIGANQEEIKDYFVHNFPKYEIRFWGDDNYCELSEIGLNKATALQYVADSFGIEHENIYVFGDANNDKEILKSFKNSFLMKNGAPSLREYANFVTTYSNNEYGVEKEIKKIFNIKID